MNSLSLEVAGLGGTNRFVRSIVNSTVFLPFKWGTVFSLHGELGHIEGFGGKEVPIDEKFFLGGINTIRGYGGRTVSPFITSTCPPSTATARDPYHQPGVYRWR